MAISSGTKKKSNNQVEEHSNILNNLALNIGDTPSIPLSINTSDGRRYPTRQRRKLEQGSEPPKASANIAGKLKRPTNRRARDINDIEKGTRVIDNQGSEAELHDFFASAKSHSTEGRSSSPAEAENSASACPQGNEFSIQEHSVNHQSSTLHEEPCEHPGCLELFGQESAWEAVLEGAQDVEQSNLGLLRLKNQTIKRFVKTTKLAKRIFEKISSEQDMNNVDRKKLTLELENALTEIRENVEELDEAATGEETSAVITDIYAYAIPNLVFMLQSALRCRTPDYGSLDDTEVLQAMISMQDTILLLCEKAKSWKERPDSELPIVRPTKQKMGPNLRIIRKAFQAELNRRERSNMHKQRERRVAEGHERRLMKAEKEKEENVQRCKESAMNIKQDLDQTRMRLGLQPREKMTSQKRNGGKHKDGNANHRDSSDQWTDEQNLELIVQLQNPDSRHLPSMYSTEPCPQALLSFS